MVIAMIVVVCVILIAVVVGVFAARGSQAARAKGMDKQRDVTGNVRAR